MTRNYKVLSGSELIELGIRDCNEPKTNEPRIKVASAAAGKPPLAAQPGAEKPLLAGLMDKMRSVLGAGAADAMHNCAAVSSRLAAKPAPAEVLLAEIPLPSARPVEHPQAALAEATQAVPLPPRRPPDAALSAVHRLARVALPKIITGAQPTLPPGFSAYAAMDR